MFGLGSICDKLAGEVVSEEYLWLADIGCAGVDALTGNWGNAVELALKAGADGAAAAGDKKLAEGLSIANMAQGAVTCDILNKAGQPAATGGVKIFELKFEPLTGTGLFGNAARNAAGVGTGVAIGEAKGGNAQDIREGIAIGTGAAGIANGCLKVPVDEAGDVKTMMGNASLLGRDTAAFATAIAVAERKSATDKRTAGAIGGAIGAAVDLPDAMASLSEERQSLDRLLAVERTAADIASISFDLKTAGLNGHEHGKNLKKAQVITGEGIELLTGATRDAADGQNTTTGR